MDSEEGLMLVNRLLYPGLGRNLDKVQTLIIRELWHEPRKTYLQISTANSYTEQYIREIGSDLWRRLSEVLDSPVSKQNFQSVLEQYQRSQHSLFELCTSSENIKWTEIDETRWVGRKDLVKTLVQALQSDCRILSLVGIAGIGKTALATKIQSELEEIGVISESNTLVLNSGSSVFELIIHAILGEQALRDEKLKQDHSLLLNIMIAKLSSEPRLLILDMVENVLEVDNIGRHQFKELSFSNFLAQMVWAENMPSRLIMTSQDQTPVIAEGRYPGRIYSKELGGLTEPEALSLFEAWGVQPHDEFELRYLKQIIKYYEGHPLALKVIGGEISESPYYQDILAHQNDYSDQILTTKMLDRHSVNLVDLVRTRIEHSLIRLQESHPLAHQLLCMGSEEEEGAERKAWLFLISEFSVEKQNLAFHILQRRYLLEEKRMASHKVFYRLHSLVRSVASEQLKHLARLPLDS